MTTQPIRDKAHIKNISKYFISRNEYRNNLLLFMTGIHTALRISDILRLTWDDVFDFGSGKPKREFQITEGKTGKSKIVAVHSSLRKAIALYLCSLRKSPAHTDFLFANARTNRAISRIQAYRILRAAAKAVQPGLRVSPHSLRKTFGYHLIRQGKPLAVIMDVYQHSSFAVTRRYLGLTQDDTDRAYRELSYS